MCNTRKFFVIEPTQRGWRTLKKKNCIYIGYRRDVTVDVSYHDKGFPAFEHLQWIRFSIMQVSVTYETKSSKYIACGTIQPLQAALIEIILSAKKHALSFAYYLIIRNFMGLRNRRSQWCELSVRKFYRMWILILTNTVFPNISRSSFILQLKSSTFYSLIWLSILQSISIPPLKSKHYMVCTLYYVETGGKKLIYWSAFPIGECIFKKNEQWLW